MNREERRAKEKLWRRRSQWLDKERKRSKAIDTIVAQLEENFDEDEVDNAKAFVVDYITGSGSFSQYEEINGESLDKICQDYRLEPADGIYIMDMLDEVLSAEKEGEE